MELWVEGSLVFYNVSSLSGNKFSNIEEDLFLIWKLNFRFIRKCLWTSKKVSQLMVVSFNWSTAVFLGELSKPVVGLSTLSHKRKMLPAKKHKKIILSDGHKPAWEIFLSFNFRP